MRSTTHWLISTKLKTGVSFEKKTKNLLEKRYFQETLPFYMQSTSNLLISLNILGTGPWRGSKIQAFEDERDFM